MIKGCGILFKTIQVRQKKVFWVATPMAHGTHIKHSMSQLRVNFQQNFPAWLNCKCPKQVHSCSKIASWEGCKMFWLGYMDRFWWWDCFSPSFLRWRSHTWIYAACCNMFCLWQSSLPNPGRMYWIPKKTIKKNTLVLLLSLVCMLSHWIILVKGYVHGKENILLGSLTNALSRTT